jgi:hypothetical protein
VTKLLYILLLSSLSANLWLAFKPSMHEQDSTPNPRFPRAKKVAAAPPREGGEQAKISDPSQARVNTKDMQLIGIPASDLSLLMDYDFRELKVGIGLQSYLDLKPQDVARLNDCLANWIAKASSMEESNLTVNEESDTDISYTVTVAQEERDRFIQNARNEIELIVGAEKTNIVESVLLAHPRFSLLRETLQLEMSVNPTGEIDFHCLEFKFTASRTNADYISKTINRYGHLFEFSEWTQLQEK